MVRVGGRVGCAAVHECLGSLDGVDFVVVFCPLACFGVSLLSSCAAVFELSDAAMGSGSL